MNYGRMNYDDLLIFKELLKVHRGKSGNYWNKMQWIKLKPFSTRSANLIISLKYFLIIQKLSIIINDIFESIGIFLFHAVFCVFKKFGRLSLTVFLKKLQTIFLKDVALNKRINSMSKMSLKFIFNSKQNVPQLNLLKALL